ncbi:MAG: hypothetical protein ACK56I_14970, partial [bacterium]
GLVEQLDPVGDVDRQRVRPRVVVDRHPEDVRPRGVVDRHPEAFRQHRAQLGDALARVAAHRVDRMRQVGGDVEQVVDALVDDRDRLVQEAEGLELAEEPRRQPQPVDDRHPGQVPEAGQGIGTDHAHIDRLGQRRDPAPHVDDRDRDLDPRIDVGRQQR